VVFLTVFRCRPVLHAILDGLNRLCDRHLSLPGDGHKGTTFTRSARVLHPGSMGDVFRSLPGHRISRASDLMSEVLKTAYFLHPLLH